MTPDPIGLAGGINPYRYANADPINWVDPDGLNPLAGAIEGASIGGSLGGPLGAAGGAVIGGLAGAAIGQWAWDNWFANESNEEGDQCSSEKANNPRGNPSTGEPGEWVEHPHGKQDRQYGPDGNPQVDIDYGHDHGQGTPHAHNWKNGIRGPGVPVSVIK